MRCTTTRVVALESSDLGGPYRYLEHILLTSKNFLGAFEVRKFSKNGNIRDVHVKPVDSVQFSWIFSEVRKRCVFFVLRVQMQWEYVRWTTLTLWLLLRS